ncbi:hypothetical protein ACUNWD_20350 [Sunxiuqinia sp. A32]|uniref:hypothetical protein n=1 Tax=Sunxiuqinia sp. A32 TaxID=3461496 RepID=UPI00404647B1
MNRPLYHIIKRLVLVIIPVILTMAFAMAQTPVYQGQTSKLEVEEHAGDTYTWEIYRDSTVNFATTTGDAPITDASFPNGNSGPSVDVTWHEPGIYFYKVTAIDAAGCTNNLKVGRIEILESLPTAIITADSICVGDPAVLNVELTGTGPWSITYTTGVTSKTITGIDTTSYEIVLDPAPTTTTQYWITEVQDQFGTNTGESEKALLEVYPKPNSSRIYQYDKE